MSAESLDDLLLSLEYHCRSRRLSDHTLRQYSESLRRLYQWLGKEADLSELTPQALERHLAEFAKGRRPATLKHHFAGLQAVFKWHAGREGYLSPMMAMPTPQVPESRKDIVTVEDCIRVVTALPRARYRDAAIVSLLFDGGLRVTELVSLDWSDIDWKERTIQIRDAKNKEVRLVPFSPLTGVKLDALRSKRKDKDAPWVFAGKRGTRLTRSGVLQMVKPLFEKHGLSGISPHDLRHSFATAWLDANPQATDTLMAIGGWKSETMMRHYTRKNRQARAVEDYRRNAPLAKGR